MPGRDKTGPMGMGAMTGRQDGPCAENKSEKKQTSNYGPGMGRRFGAGRRWMRGCRGWGKNGDMSFFPRWMHSTSMEKQATDTEQLKHQIKDLKTSLDAINNYLKTLKKGD